MADKQFTYPDYALSEQIADAVMHGMGLLLAVVGGSLLIAFSFGHVSAGLIVALLIYGLAILASFAASACYHHTPWKRYRPTLRRFDHAAIYLKIAGTYTPLVVILGSALGYVVLAAVWAIAAFGVIAKLFFWSRQDRSGVWLYLLMGWLSVFLLYSMVPVLPWLSTSLIAIGGGLYTLGVIFYNWESLKFSNAIWHGFVVSASSCFFAAIALATWAGAA